jgi:hypothetical protein
MEVDGRRARFPGSDIRDMNSSSVVFFSCHYIRDIEKLVYVSSDWRSGSALSLCGNL